MDRLFVYGSLQPGAPNAHVLADLGNWAGGSILGVLDDAGWGASLGYPGVRSVGAGTRIRGQVLTADALPWAELDAFEGDEYVRLVVMVDLDDGGTVEAAVYALAPP